MEKTMKEKDLISLRQTAIIEAERLKAMQIMLDEDHRHEAELRTSLTFYMCCLNRLFNTKETAEVWNDYLKIGYNQLLNSADNRFKGFREDIDHLLFDLEVERRKADEAERLLLEEKERRKAERALAKEQKKAGQQKEPEEPKAAAKPKKSKASKSAEPVPSVLTVPDVPSVPEVVQPVQEEADAPAKPKAKSKPKAKAAPKKDKTDNE